MMDHLSLYKGFGSFLILAFTSSSARCSTTRVILAMIFSLSLRGYLVRENHITGGKLVLPVQDDPSLSPQPVGSCSVISRYGDDGCVKPMCAMRRQEAHTIPRDSFDGYKP